MASKPHNWYRMRYPYILCPNCKNHLLGNAKDEDRFLCHHCNEYIPKKSCGLIAVMDRSKDKEEVRLLCKCGQYTQNKNGICDICDIISEIITDK